MSAKKILVVDVEATGQDPESFPLIEFGACVWTIGEKTPDSEFYAFLGLPESESQWCPRTKKEFWDNVNSGHDGKTLLQILKERLDKEKPKKQTLSQAANAFVHWARKQYKDAGGSIVLMFDTAGFDYSFLNHLLRNCDNIDKNADYPHCYPHSPIYLFGDYQPTRDLSSLMLGASKMFTKFGTTKAFRKVYGNEPNWFEQYKHTHHPLDDAKKIAATASWALETLSKQ